MKVNRLLEIIILLMNKRTLTAGELAERFQVSVRTIYRDIDILSTAGVPVTMSRGSGGGISLMEGYSLSKVHITEAERDSLLLALQTLQATKYPQTNLILEKMRAVFKDFPQIEWIEIDFSRWGSNPNEKNKFNQINKALKLHKVIFFDYVNSDGFKSSRFVEPVKLLYKGNTWYLIAFCRKRESFRVFRLTRVKNVIVTEESFVPKAFTLALNEEGEDLPLPVVNLKLRFQPKVLNRIYDDFDDALITRNKDGTMDVEVDFPEDEWVYGYILSYGSSVEVIKPPHIRRIVSERLKQALEKYKDG